MSDGNSKYRRQRIALSILCGVLGVLLAAALAVTFYAEHLFGLISRTDTEATLSPEDVATLPDSGEPPASDFTGPTLDPTDVTFPSRPPEPVLPEEKHTVSILLIGQDRRAGQGRQRSDSMILCTFHPEDNTVTMISFLRDTYVQIPGYRNAKLNAAYQWGGSQLLKQTLFENFGILPDACVSVDFSGFQQIIDLLKGVNISLTAQEVTLLNHTHGWKLKEGTNCLTGQQALAYARIRVIGNDFARARRQRNVLSAIVEGSRDLSMSEVMSLLETALPLLSTDMSNAQILRYAMELFPMLSGADIKTLQIPANGMYEAVWIGNQDVLLPDLEKNCQLLSEFLG